MSVDRRIAGLALVLATLGTSRAGAAPRVPDAEPLRHWVEGPVRYIATDDEIREFKHRKDDKERAVFIARFWVRRDPDPTTAANEYRQIFWDRVREANSKFTDSPGPGWKTDRGKIYILHGPPTEIREDINAKTQTDPSAGRGLIRWTYEGRPEGRLELDPVVVVPFYRTSSGEYKLSYDPKLTSVFFDWMYKPTQGSTLLNFIESMSNATSSRLGAMLDLGKMEDVPRQEEYLLGQVETYESFQTREQALRVDRYAPAGAGGGVVVVTVPLIRHDPPQASSIVARFRPKDPKGRVRTLAEGSFRTEEFGTDRLAQARIVLEAGDYDLDVAVLDPADAATGLARRTIRVDDSRDRLRVSDVAPAVLLEPVRFRSLASYDAPFVVGGFRMAPLVGRPLRAGEELRLFYEIYGGTAPYRVSYQIEGREADGTWVPLGQRQVLDPADQQQGWGFPTTAKWPRGDYRVRLQVTDRAGASVEEAVPFALADPLP